MFGLYVGHRLFFINSASIYSTNIYNCLEVCFSAFVLKNKESDLDVKKNVPVLSVIAVVSEFIA